MLDFNVSPPRFNIGLNLDHINVADAPRSWQLDEVGATGRLSGKVQLAARLAPAGVDLSGTTGDAVLEGGKLQGIPFKSLRLSLTARGNDLRYESPRGDSSSNPPVPAPDELAQILTAVGTVASQGPPSAEPKPAPATEFPKSLTTQIELADVDVSLLVRRAEFLLGYPFPVPAAGKLSIKAEATIPLGRLRSLRDYAFHGDLTLTGASVYRVDLDRVAARIDLSEGVLVLKNFRGRLIDRPDGGPDNPPPSSDGDVPPNGPLPAGGFRGTLRAEVSPPGRLTARFEGEGLPMGELAAPLLPRPTPLSGLASMLLDAAVDLNAARDPASWVASGSRGASRSIIAARSWMVSPPVPARFGTPRH